MMWSMQGKWSATLGCLALVSLSALAGCGRDALLRTCTSNAECGGDLVCQAGECRDPLDGPDMLTPDMQPPDMSPPDMQRPDMQRPDMPPPPDMMPDFPPPPDMEPDLEPFDCRGTSECPGGGEEFEQGGVCRVATCLARICLYDQVNLGCPPNSRQEGCRCVALMGECVTSQDCGGQACVNNMCRPCRTNAECGELVCRDDGTCGRCTGDLDCSANEVCQQGACSPRPECLLDRDCGPQEVCFNGRCSFSPECTQDVDCAPNYECVGDRCFEALCRGPEDCAPDELCDAGVCVEQPATIDRCFVATQGGTVSPGQTLRLDAFAVDAQGGGLAANFDWTSTAPAVVSVAGRTATARNVAGTATLTASLRGMPIQCDGEVVLTNIGPPPMTGGLRVIVLDTESGAPVQGAQVVINSNTAVLTNNAGVANLPIPMGAYQLSVFSQAHDWVTIQGARAQDVRVPLNRRSGTGVVAGFQGRFDRSQLSSQGDFNLGLAGASIPGGLINFDLSKLLGDPFNTSVSIPTQGTFEFPIPSGLTIDGTVFGFPLNIKRDYYATTPGGARLAWGLAGRVPVNQLIALFQGGGFGNVGDVLALLLPLFNRFDHGIKPLQLTALPRVQDVMDINGNGDTLELVPDYANFPSHALRPNVRQQLNTSVSVSNLPSLTDGPAEFAILVGGTQLDATGFVPLGISATTDNDGDGRPDVRRLSMAPPYSSLVGGRFAVFCVAFRTDAFGAGGAGVEFPDEFSAALWNGQALPTAIQLGTFPNTSVVSENPNARTLTFNGNAGPLYRARFLAVDRSWDVWSPGPAGMAGFFSHAITVPAAPANQQDIFVGANKVLLDSIRTQVSIDDLLRPTGVLLYDAALVSTGFSRTLVR